MALAEQLRNEPDIDDLERESLEVDGNEEGFDIEIQPGAPIYLVPFNSAIRLTAVPTRQS